MTRSELINRLAKRFPKLLAIDADISVKHIIEALSKALVAGDRVEIRGFGSFELSSRPPRVGRNPKTGETVLISGKVKPHFRPGKMLKTRLTRIQSRQVIE